MSNFLTCWRFAILWRNVSYFKTTVFWLSTNSRYGRQIQWGMLQRTNTTTNSFYQ